MKSDLRIAFGSVPKDSGTFTFYRNISPALRSHGITMYCVAVGKDQALLWDESFADGGCVLLARNTYNVKRQAREFVAWCCDLQIDIVMGINSEAILSSIPHLPASIRVVSRCANGFDHGYRITLSGKFRLQAIIAITPRLRDDLLLHYGANPDIMHLIPNGIDFAKFDEIEAKVVKRNKTLYLGFLGRLEHTQKGVFHIPDLLKSLSKLNVDYHLSIAGKGADRERLEQMLSPWVNEGQVTFLGSLSRESVPKFLSKLDVYVFPSHFEGCPNSLLEAMMAGCVTVAWKIKGITDFLLKDKETGFLHGIGDYEEMANNIRILSKNRVLLEEMSTAVRKDARARFDPKLVAKDYAAVFKSVMAKPQSHIEPFDWQFFQPDSNFKQKGDKFLSRRLKKILKGILFPKKAR